jgi:hypothetical protein
MHQRGGLQRVVGSFAEHLAGRQLSQLLIDQRQQPLGRLWVAPLDLLKNLCDVGHAG